jgi:hypothetical protein
MRTGGCIRKTPKHPKAPQAIWEFEQKFVLAGRIPMICGILQMSCVCEKAIEKYMKSV